MYNVAGRDRTSDLGNNSLPCNHTEDFVWNWPYHPKFVTDVYQYIDEVYMPYVEVQCMMRIMRGRKDCVMYDQQ